VSAADDQLFLKRFSLVLVLLAAFALLIVALSITLDNTVYRPEPPARDLAREQRLAPVSGVFAGETGRAAAHAAREAAAAERTVAAAFDGSLDGELIYERACASCHVSGAAGAPLMVASAWVGRVEKGMATLVANAINGIGAMPPRGGRMDLTDEQIEVSVAFMLDMLD
jgi:cytochrome c5